MENHSTVKELFSTMLVIVLSAFLIGVFLTSNIFYYIIGLALGTLYSVARTLMLERNIRRSLDMDAASAQNYMKLMFALRYFLSLAALAIFAIVPWIDLWGGVIGVFSLQVAAYIVNIRIKNQPVEAFSGADTK